MVDAPLMCVQVLGHYPKVFKLGQALERRVERVIEVEKDKRPDLYCLALAWSRPPDLCLALA